MKYLFIIISAFFLTACGTFTTLNNNDDGVSDHLKERETYCESLPRVYSGVSYDFCTLHSNPKSEYFDFFMMFYLTDMAFSAVGDTLALPYSIRAQSKYSNLEIRGKQ